METFEWFISDFYNLPKSFISVFDFLVFCFSPYFSNFPKRISTILGKVAMYNIKLINMKGISIFRITCIYLAKLFSQKNTSKFSSKVWWFIQNLNFIFETKILGN